MQSRINKKLAVNVTPVRKVISDQEFAKSIAGTRIDVLGGLPELKKFAFLIRKPWSIHSSRLMSVNKAYVSLPHVPLHYSIAEMVPTAEAFYKWSYPCIGCVSTEAKLYSEEQKHTLLATPVTHYLGLKIPRLAVQLGLTEPVIKYHDEASLILEYPTREMFALYKNESSARDVQARLESLKFQ